ncbi:MAG: hypothetical protein QOG48_1767 [Verrucomicrobiota bacterium]
MHRYQRTVLVLATLLLLLPFTGKAFHIDDPLFIWTARQIQVHPSDPYGFDVNWYGKRMRMADVTKNPPLASGYIALLAAMFGEREFWLHLGFVVQAVAAVLGTHALAQRFCQQPFYAALAGLLTPVFLVSSTTLMCDVLMLALWVWAAVFWLHALEKKEARSFIVASLLIAACALSKYFGLALLPLLVVYSLVKVRRPGWWLAYLLIPIAIFALYECWSRSLYGKWLLLDAVIYAREESFPPVQPVVEFLTTLGFAGGCFATVLIFAPFLWPKKIWISGAVASLFFLTITRSPLPFTSYLQWTMMIVGGGSIICLALVDFGVRLCAKSLMLLLWVLGTFFFCLHNWTINGRSLLPMAPAVAILLCRRLDQTRWRYENPFLILAFAIAALVSLLVVQGDYELAKTARTAAAQIARIENSPVGIKWFQGHWGFQYYAEAQGWRPFDTKSSQLQYGDLMVMPMNNYGVMVIRSRPSERVNVIREYPRAVVAMMNGPLGAGFYSAGYGPFPWLPLPFLFHSVPGEEYRIERFK